MGVAAYLIWPMNFGRDQGGHPPMVLVCFLGCTIVCTGRSRGLFLSVLLMAVCLTNSGWQCVYQERSNFRKLCHLQDILEVVLAPLGISNKHLNFELPAGKMCVFSDLGD